MDYCTMDDCIAPYGIHYIGGGTPLGPAARRAAPPVEAAPGGGSTP
jgi:hypothetical protein